MKWIITWWCEFRKPIRTFAYGRAFQRTKEFTVENAQEFYDAVKAYVKNYEDKGFHLTDQEIMRFRNEED